MRLADLIQLTGSAIRAQRTRSLLTGLGIAVGIAAVVLLTAIAEGVQRFVIAEFTQFGTNLLAVTPGKTQTFGILGATISTVRPLSLDDAQSLRRLPQVRSVVAFVQGNGAVEWKGAHPPYQYLRYRQRRARGLADPARSGPLPAG